MTRPIRKGNKRPSRELDQALGRRIRAHRQALGLTQTDLAQRIDVTYQQLMKYEHGESQVSPGRLVMIAEALKLDAAQLLEEAQALLGIGRSSPPPDRTQIELQVVARQVTPAGRRALLAVAKAMVGGGG